jgi:RNA polymerase sigma-70 factor (ECF subfamily)
MSEAPLNSSRSLVERVGSGDGAAEDELVRAWLPRVVAFATVRTQDRDLASELGQDVMLAVLCALREGRMREPDKLPAFVYGTARNLLNDALRRRAREKLDPLPPDLECARSSSGGMEESDRLAAAHQAIDTLDPADRKILLLTLVDGLKPADIGHAVGLSSMVVRQRKSRALKKVIEMVRGGSQRPVALRLHNVSERRG